MYHYALRLLIEQALCPNARNNNMASTELEGVGR